MEFTEFYLIPRTTGSLKSSTTPLWTIWMPNLRISLQMKPSFNEKSHKTRVQSEKMNALKSFLWSTRPRPKPIFPPKPKCFPIAMIKTLLTSTYQILVQWKFFLQETKLVEIGQGDCKSLIVSSRICKKTSENFRTYQTIVWLNALGL